MSPSLAAAAAERPVIQGRAYFSTDGGRFPPRQFVGSKPPSLVRSNLKKDQANLIHHLRSKWPHICLAIVPGWDIRDFWDEYDFHTQGGKFLYDTIMVMMHENDNLLRSFCIEWSHYNQANFSVIISDIGVQQLFHETDHAKYGVHFLSRALSHMRDAYTRAAAEERQKANVPKQPTQFLSSSDPDEATQFRSVDRPMIRWTPHGIISTPHRYNHLSDPPAPLTSQHAAPPTVIPQTVVQLGMAPTAPGFTPYPGLGVPNIRPPPGFTNIPSFEQQLPFAGGVPRTLRDTFVQPHEFPNQYPFNGREGSQSWRRKSDSMGEQLQAVPPSEFNGSNRGRRSSISRGRGRRMSDTRRPSLSYPNEDNAQAKPGSSWTPRGGGDSWNSKGRRSTMDRVADQQRGLPAPAEHAEPDKPPASKEPGAPGITASVNAKVQRIEPPFRSKESTNDHKPKADPGKALKQDPESDERVPGPVSGSKLLNPADIESIESRRMLVTRDFIGEDVTEILDLFVKNVPESTSRDEIAAAFNPIAPVADIRLGRHTFVSFRNTNDVRTVLKARNAVSPQSGQRFEVSIPFKYYMPTKSRPHPGREGATFLEPHGRPLSCSKGEPATSSADVRSRPVEGRSKQEEERHIMQNSRQGLYSLQDARSAAAPGNTDQSELQQRQTYANAANTAGSRHGSEAVSIVPSGPAASQVQDTQGPHVEESQAKPSQPTDVAHQLEAAFKRWATSQTGEDQIKNPEIVEKLPAPLPHSVVPGIKDKKAPNDDVKASDSGMDDEPKLHDTTVSPLVEGLKDKTVASRLEKEPEGRIAEPVRPEHHPEGDSSTPSKQKAAAETHAPPQSESPSKPETPTKPESPTKSEPPTRSEPPTKIESPPKPESLTKPPWPSKPEAPSEQDVPPETEAPSKAKAPSKGQAPTKAEVPSKKKGASKRQNQTKASAKDSSAKVESAQTSMEHLKIPTESEPQVASTPVSVEVSTQQEHGKKIPEPLTERAGKVEQVKTAKESSQQAKGKTQVKKPTPLILPALPKGRPSGPRPSSTSSPSSARKVVSEAAEPTKTGKAQKPKRFPIEDHSSKQPSQAASPLPEAKESVANDTDEDQKPEKGPHTVSPESKTESEDEQASKGDEPPAIFEDTGTSENGQVQSSKPRTPIRRDSGLEILSDSIEWRKTHQALEKLIEDLSDDHKMKSTWTAEAESFANELNDIQNRIRNDEDKRQARDLSKSQRKKKTQRIRDDMKTFKSLADDLEMLRSRVHGCTETPTLAVQGKESMQPRDPSKAHDPSFLNGMGTYYHKKQTRYTVQLETVLDTSGRQQEPIGNLDEVMQQQPPPGGAIIPASDPAGHWQPGNSWTDVKSGESFRFTNSGRNGRDEKGTSTQQSESDKSINEHLPRSGQSEAEDHKRRKTMHPSDVESERHTPATKVKPDDRGKRRRSGHSDTSFDGPEEERVVELAGSKNKKDVPSVRERLKASPPKEIATELVKDIAIAEYNKRGRQSPHQRETVSSSETGGSSHTITGGVHDLGAKDEDADEAPKSLKSQSSNDETRGQEENPEMTPKPATEENRRPQAPASPSSPTCPSMSWAKVVGGDQSEQTMPAGDPVSDKGKGKAEGLGLDLGDVDQNALLEAPSGNAMSPFPPPPEPQRSESRSTQGGGHAFPSVGGGGAERTCNGGGERRDSQSGRGGHGGEPSRGGGERRDSQSGKGPRGGIRGPSGDWKVPPGEKVWASGKKKGG